MNSFIAFLAFCNFCNVIVIFCSGTDNTRESDLKKLHSSIHQQAKFTMMDRNSRELKKNMA